MTAIDTLLKSTNAVLLDFDGPVCRLFSGYPASVIASQLRAHLYHGGAALPEMLAEAADPLKLLRWTGSNRPDLLPASEALLASAEFSAVDTATPTAHCNVVMEQAKNSGRLVAIVSNNSEPAIARYLRIHDMASHVAKVVGRVAGYPDRMKPHPDPIARAAQALNVRTETCVLVGDAPTDIEAARSAGARSIGYAKQPDRIAGLVSAGADVVIESMATLADALELSQPAA